jgi:hypothetical protein
VSTRGRRSRNGSGATQLAGGRRRVTPEQWGSRAGVHGGRVGFAVPHPRSQT